MDGSRPIDHKFAGASRPVLLVAPQSFFVPAGTPINVMQMCRALGQLGYQVHLLTLPMGESPALPNVIYHRPIGLPFIKRVPVGFSLGKAVYDVVLAVHMIGLLARNRFRAVHAIEEAIFFAAPIARLFRVPAIADLDSDLCRQLADSRNAFVRALAPFARPVRRVAIRLSAAAITVAEALTHLVAEIAPSTPAFEIKDIPLDAALRSADADEVARLRVELGIGERRAAVYTGNFDTRQGVALLVGAMRAVHARHDDAVLVLVGGEGEEISRLRDIARKHGVEDAVIFAGRRPPESMPEFMALGEVLASPRLEALITPLKIFSYMASGRPIVATDLPTHTQVLGPDSAILAPPTEKGIADGIVRALDDPVGSRALAREARRLVELNHDFEGFKQRLGDVYAFVVDGVLPEPGLAPLRVDA